ncbi:type II toxin-antitoxin system RelE/ParE family toxin [Pontibacter sp. G13]|uniref:type II toxin-antitoxin system RelE/ParE family toxin n=1 Tax=Pontibacter sp. G13 TaxID=3074898 RepID=UPI00288A0F89|nr:type II toxin-antitoxin system RelE/ParE family toxin [Pontibacter sp. G13]WNJ17415.1 type II toxin-antitoxin system RelE/ParE family toxin [Pontibacter sp. G13]
MSNAHYRISRKALSDLRSIWNYSLAKWSEDQADKYYQLIIQKIEFLSNHPESGKEIDDIRAGYRSSKVKSHLIFYRLGNDGVLEVIRILHQMMDIPNRLND